MTQVEEDTQLATCLRLPPTATVGVSEGTSAVDWAPLHAQAASAGATPASLASLDSLLESLHSVAGLRARMQALQWALSLRQNILSQVNHRSLPPPEADVGVHCSCAPRGLLTCQATAIATRDLA